MSVGETFRRAYSFIGGALIGIAGSLAMFGLDADEDGRAGMLLVSLLLACAGIGMHVAASKATLPRVARSAAQRVVCTE